METAKPQRIKLSRRGGFNLQEASFKLNGLPAVNCARPSRWGNPFKVGGYVETHNSKGSIIRRIKTTKRAVELFARMIEMGDKAFVIPDFKKEEIKKHLRGKNLACWCPLNQPHCHVTVLLKIANT